MKKKFLLFCLLATSGSIIAQDWPTIQPEARPSARWWWLGSAVDKENLTYNLEEYAKAGLGAMEITPIYGVQGNDKNNIPYLTPQWMDILQHTQAEGKRLGIQIDMNMGTGWPFGGRKSQNPPCLSWSNCGQLSRQPPLLCRSPSCSVPNSREQRN